eukprot:TRINITY_DN7905_c0_g1_i1.p1 TRINITY_DN7905_c0_g1~~TRINITY_DN7905_c0_g1_i1.p1  ORF type:complete len:361 (+),score=26.36 TRINITY_DN7905_c0_g1_i1:55-1137(+)
MIFLCVFVPLILVVSAQGPACDIEYPAGICIGGGSHETVMMARPKDLVLHFNFDQTKVIDQSGNRLHSNSTLIHGPSFGSEGTSSFFSGSNFLYVPDNELLHSKEFSITFWLFVMRNFAEDPRLSVGLRWCPILQKGFDIPSRKQFFRSPAIFFDRKDRALRIFLSTSERSFPQGEYLTSNARIPFQRWTHVAVVRKANKMRLYVNGILDAVNITMGFSLPTPLFKPSDVSENGLYVGAVPWYKEECNIPHLTDELRFYSRPLSEVEIEAEGSPGLGGVEPRFVHLGCFSCSLDVAVKSCIEGYHLCTKLELFNGGLQVARYNGWYDAKVHVWSYSELEIPLNEEEPIKLGLGICCLNSS